MDDVGLATRGSDTSVTYGAMKEDDRRVDSLDHFMKSTHEPLPQVAIPGVGMGVALPGPDAGAAPMAAFLSGRQDRSTGFQDGKKVSGCRKRSASALEARVDARSAGRP